MNNVFITAMVFHCQEWLASVPDYLLYLFKTSYKAMGIHVLNTNKVLVG
jgi:hypothetical protein